MLVRFVALVILIVLLPGCASPDPSLRAQMDAQATEIAQLKAMMATPVSAPTPTATSLALPTESKTPTSVATIRPTWTVVPSPTAAAKPAVPPAVDAYLASVAPFSLRLDEALKRLRSLNQEVAADFSLTFKKDWINRNKAELEIVKSFGVFVRAIKDVPFELAVAHSHLVLAGVAADSMVEAYITALDYFNSSSLKRALGYWEDVDSAMSRFTDELDTVFGNYQRMATSTASLTPSDGAYAACVREQYDVILTARAVLRDDKKPPLGSEEGNRISAEQMGRMREAALAIVTCQVPPPPSDGNKVSSIFREYANSVIGYVENFAEAMTRLTRKDLQGMEPFQQAALKNMLRMNEQDAFVTAALDKLPK